MGTTVGTCYAVYPLLRGNSCIAFIICRLKAHSFKCLDFDPSDLRVIEKDNYCTATKKRLCTANYFDI